MVVFSFRKEILLNEKYHTKFFGKKQHKTRVFPKKERPKPLFPLIP